ncbi:hypothetical protein T492DRAFT_856756 [Pavlovales sp. CCMP2436]|nr:hypothetical protein T492DRAFT_856756 [Pavlovales sp. CCMP2436]
MSRPGSYPAGDARRRARSTSPWERTSQALTARERWAATATIGINQQPSFVQHQNLPFRTAAAATVGLSQQPSFAQRQDPPFRTAAAASVGLYQQPSFAQRQEPPFRTAAAATVGLNQQSSFAQPSLAQWSIMQRRDPPFRTAAAASVGLSQRPSFAQSQDLPFLATTAATVGLNQPPIAQHIGLNLLDRRATAPTVGQPSYENGTPHASPAIRTPEWVADLASFIASWSDSSISQYSLALRELNHFLNKAAGTPFDVPPVQLRAFLMEAALRGTSPAGATWPTVQMSQKFTGHSLRHFMTEIGGAMLMDPATVPHWDATQNGTMGLDEFCLNPGALHPLILAIAMGAGVPATSLISHLTAATRGPSAILTATTIPTPDPRVPSRATGSMIEWRNPA